jgi:hypothetical protein
MIAQQPARRTVTLIHRTKKTQKVMTFGSSIALAHIYGLIRADYPEYAFLSIA